MIPTPQRILAIDYGSRWLGLAWSDPSFTIVAGSRSIDRKKTTTPVLDLIEESVQELGVTGIIVGMPYNMDGSVGFKARETQNFINKLMAKLNISVSHWDERIKTVRAENELRQLGTKKRSGRQVDEMAASFILQAYLESISSHPPREDNP